VDSALLHKSLEVQVRALRKESLLGMLQMRKEDMREAYGGAGEAEVQGVREGEEVRDEIYK